MAYDGDGFSYSGELFTDMWRATRVYYAKRLIDMLPRAHPLLAKMAGQGNIQAKEGGVGKRNVELILARPNTNLRWVSFDEEITKTNTQLLEQIEYDWKFCYQDFVLLDKVLAINSSDEVANLLEINQRALRQGFAWNMAKQLYAAGNEYTALSTDTKKNALEMGGLGYLISDNPYKVDEQGKPIIVLNLTRGGTPGDKYEFWRNRAGQWTKDDTGGAAQWKTTRAEQAEQLVDAMRNMIQVIETTSEDSVDSIYMNYFFYNLYVYYMQERLHINNVAGEKKDAGFTNVEFMGVPLYLDKYCPNNKIYFINSKYLHFKYLQGENFKQEVRVVPNFFMKQYITTFIGNFIIEKPRAQGVITLNDTTNDLPSTANVCDFANYVDYDYNPTYKTGNTSDGSLENQDYSGSGVYTGSISNASSNKGGKK